MKKTYFSIVIHSDFPVVEPFDYQAEADFFERLTLLYIPLFYQCKNDHYPFPLAMAFSPSLIENLSNEPLMERYASYLLKRDAFLDREVSLSTHMKEKAVYSRYKEQSGKFIQLLREYEGNILDLLSDLMGSGKMIAVSQEFHKGTELHDHLIGEEGFAKDSNYLDPKSDVAYEKNWNELKDYSLWPDFRGALGIKLFKREKKHLKEKKWYESEEAHKTIETHAAMLVDLLQEETRNSAISSQVNLLMTDIGSEWVEFPLFLKELMRKIETCSMLEWFTHSPIATFPQVDRKDLFYSANSSHNHLVREEKKAGKQRILMLSWEFPPSVVGGLGKHVWELANALTSLGHDVSLLTPSFVGAPDYEKINGIHVHRIKEIHQTFDDFHLYVARFNMNMVEKAVELNVQSDFTVIHAHDWMVGLAARSIKNILSIPLVTTIHASETGRLNGNPPTPLQEMTLRQEEGLISDSDKVIVCSDYMEKELQREFAFRKEKLSVIPNGVRIFGGSEESDNINGLLERYPHKHLVLALGRMVPEKGFDIFIEAAAVILKEYPDCLFVAGGKGPLLDAYRKRVSQLGLGKSIIFVGFLYEREKAAMLSRCDLMVVPSLYEPFGIVALEGKVAGKPVIASRTGGLANILEDHSTGLYFEPGNVGQLVDMIVEVFEDPALGKGLGEKAREIALKEYDWEDVSRKTEYIYESTITTSSVQ
ncbi:glycosyltransferase involved in cell wall biosynthesis [Bacillus tianshenii]|uniref:Glycosyltransferase involved in cell wall biosynthesis n=1 Tax=Sutcliffiella tianshenii TaxID=1463404 RepID=A0ABS2NZY7_9BACI|nr:glycosyltransferase [Bacillus tianshenii]MBM7620235.1 glycosyltransferase involved in cell wall biosynthesis [Bacillus tianshenii]